MKYILRSQVENMKSVAESLYNESRRYPGTTDEKDSYLDVLIVKFIEKTFEKVVRDDSIINQNNISELEEYSSGFQSEFRLLMEKWKKEFEIGKKRWQFWRD